MLIKVGNFEFTEVWDRVLYKKLSNYPQITDWEIRNIIDFIEYEKMNGRKCEIQCENEELLALINQKIAYKDKYVKISRPSLITECTACPQRKGCITEYVCHTTSSDNAIKIFESGKLLSAVNARKVPAEELAAEKRNAAYDPADYFEYVMLAWGNCQAGDRLVMERKLGRFPDEEDLSVNFTPGVRFYFKYDKLVQHPQVVFDGVLPMKVKDEIVLKDWVDYIIIPTALREVMKAVIPSDLSERVLYVENDCKDIWDWSEKVYSIIEQRTGCEAMKHKIQQIINEWDIEKKEIKQIYDSAWQIGEDFVLKTYEDINMLQRNIKILTILEDMGIPVGGIVLTKDKNTYARDNEYYYILTNKLSGSNITDIHKNTAIASEMGQVLARLHKVFKECETQDKFWDNSLLKEMKGWIREAFVKNNWKYIEESEFCSLVEQLEKVYDKLPVQLIQRDVHLGNFLFDNGKFSGYIDFDLSQRNIRIFDLCYFMLGLLSEEEVLNISEVKWLDILKCFFAGYEQEHKLLPEEKQAVPYVMEAIELLFVAWFMEQNDVKCAEDAMKIYQFIEKHIENIIQLT